MTPATSSASSSNGRSASGSASESRLSARSAGSPERMRLTGTSSTFPDSVRGTAGTARTSSGHVSGRAVLANSRPDPRDEIVVELDAGPQHDEERHVPLRPLAREVDDERVDDLVEREHGAVDLRRPHPDAAAVDRRVGATGDDRRAAVGDLDPVAVAPDAGERVEVARPVARAVRVAPEPDRHRRHRLGDHELADLADDRARRPRSTPRPSRRARAPAARRGTREASARRRRTRCRGRCRRTSRTARRRGRGGRRPSRSPRGRAASRSSRPPRARERSRPSRGAIPVLHAGGDEARRRAEARDACLLGEIPQRPEVGMAGVAVVEHDRSLREQPAVQEVPHHPAGRREPEEAVARLHVGVEGRASSGARAGSRRARARSPSGRPVVPEL